MPDSVFARIDGSMGEGGGQVLRSAITISAITKKPVEISGIRSRRNNPGLRAQHLAAVKAMAEFFGAEVHGLRVGSETIRFQPTEFCAKDLRIDIGTAGSIPLVLMTLIPAIALSANRASLELTGGTDVPASPTSEYLRHVVQPAYRMLGIRFSLDIVTRGYFPKGGGLVRARVEACNEPNALELSSTERISPKIISFCSQLPSHVAQRQISGALARVAKEGDMPCLSYTASLEQACSPGSGILVYHSSDSGIFIGGDSIGQLGKKAESVGTEAAEKFINACQPCVQVDSHLADMLIVPLCFAKGKSSFCCSRITSHLTTNLQVASALTGCRYRIEGHDPARVVISA